MAAAGEDAPLQSGACVLCVKSDLWRRCEQELCFINRAIAVLMTGYRDNRSSRVLPWRRFRGMPTKPPAAASEGEELQEKVWSGSQSRSQHI